MLSVCITQCYFSFLSSACFLDTSLKHGGLWSIIIFSTTLLSLWWGILVSMKVAHRTPWPLFKVKYPFNMVCKILHNLASACFFSFSHTLLLCCLCPNHTSLPTVYSVSHRFSPSLAYTLAPLPEVLFLCCPLPNYFIFCFQYPIWTSLTHGIFPW